MASTSSKFPIFVAATVGAVGAWYIVAPKTERSGGVPGPKPTDGRGQSAIDGDSSASVNSPHPALRYGGTSSGNITSQTVAGVSQESRKTGSADHDVKTHDGSKGGVGVSEMRERKEKGMGSPSPQGGDSKAKPVEKQDAYTDGQGPKQSWGWFSSGK